MTPRIGQEHARDKTVLVFAEEQGGFFESIRECHCDFSVACFGGSSIALDFSGANSGEHCCDTNVDERAGLYSYRCTGNLAVDG
jgi:hypothetical protein